jgi:outer membrane PBP1 activator LpoA protein
MFKTSNKRFCSLVMVTFLLVSCSSQTPKKTPRVVTKPLTADVVEPKVEFTAQQLINDAKQQNSSAAIQSLIQASKLSVIEQNYLQTLWLSEQLVTLVENPNEKYQLALLSADSLLNLTKVELAYEKILLAQDISKEHSINHQAYYFKLLHDIQLQRHFSISALDAKLRWFDLTHQTSSEDILALWQSLSELSTWQLSQLKQLSPPNFSGWQQLLTYAHKFGADQQRFHRYLQQWQRQYSTHPAQVVIKHLQSTSLQTTVTAKNIAVILPLTGRQEVAGKVAQQGILAAYKTSSDKTLHFIDSTAIDWTKLNDEFIRLEIDYIIGPLLKSNVSSFVTQTNSVLPTLLLNPPENVELASNQVLLSMRPEDEAIQAATTLSNQHFKMPIILSHKDNASQRIATTFANQWKFITGHTPNIAYFEQGNKMQEQLKASLDVGLSQARIKDIASRVNKKLKTETRNRRDTDMIYIVGTAAETKLLKPYIDVNTSPFAQLIPIYASSRSHSTSDDHSTNNDLKGLTFTEMPWLLASQQQNKSLVSVSDSLWPTRSDSLKRIFAMGFDSFNLVDKISLMQQFSYLRHYGQTGVLKLGKDNKLTRSLLWGSYRNNKVEEIVME